MSNSTYSNTSDLDDMELIMQAIKHDQSLQQNEAESSRRRRNPINRERNIAEARLMTDYFGDYSKYPEYYFRRRYRMNRSLFLEIVKGIETYVETIHHLPDHFKFFVVWPDATVGANNDLTVSNNSPLFDDLLHDFAPVAPFEVDGVAFEKGYYLADGIHQTWETFVKSFSVAQDEKNVVFKRRQESARKDVERAFGVFQGRWHIISQPAYAWTVNKLRRTMYTCIILHNMILKNHFDIRNWRHLYLFATKYIKDMHRAMRSVTKENQRTP
ncbi:ALP1-like protein [Tanacetum coccineum]